LGEHEVLVLTRTHKGAKYNGAISGTFPSNQQVLGRSAVLDPPGLGDSGFAINCKRAMFPRLCFPPVHRLRVGRDGLRVELGEHD
jgi:hypothetical protein